MFATARHICRSREPSAITRVSEVLRCSSHLHRRAGPGNLSGVGQRRNQPGVDDVQLTVRLAGILVMLVCFCSCGDSSKGSTATAAPAAAKAPPAVLTTTMAPTTVPTDQLPVTTLAVMPTRDDALVASATPAHVSEPCPESLGGPDGTDAMQAEMAKLEPMLGVVLAYGGQHADQFGSYGLVWQGTNDASVFVSFTADLDLHRDALDNLVAHPDELIVCQVAVSGDVARALAAKLTDDLAGRFSSVGVGGNGVNVVLMPGEEALGDELVAQYGDAVSVTICSDPSACIATAA